MRRPTYSRIHPHATKSAAKASAVAAGVSGVSARADRAAGGGTRLKSRNSPRPHRRPAHGNRMCARGRSVKNNHATGAPMSAPNATTSREPPTEKAPSSPDSMATNRMTRRAAMPSSTPHAAAGGSARIASAPRLLLKRWRSIEHVDDTGFERVLGANHVQPFGRDQSLEHLRAMAQSVR